MILGALRFIGSQTSRLTRPSSVELGEKKIDELLGSQYAVSLVMKNLGLGVVEMFCIDGSVKHVEVEGDVSPVIDKAGKVIKGATGLQLDSSCNSTASLTRIYFSSPPIEVEEYDYNSKKYIKKTISYNDLSDQLKGFTDIFRRNALEVVGIRIRSDKTVEIETPYVENYFYPTEQYWSAYEAIIKDMNAELNYVFMAVRFPLNQEPGKMVMRFGGLSK